MMDNRLDRRHWRLSGRVQGVGFRWFVLAQAQRLGITGWVRNNRDGTVELEAAGNADALNILRERVQQGPPAARVDHLVELPPGREELPDPFAIAP